MPAPYRMGLARQLAAGAKPHTVRLASDATTRSPCDLTPRSGDVATTSEGVREAQGAYVLSLPIPAALELLPEQEVVFDHLPGQRFTVVYAPAPTAHDASRSYGLDQIGR